MTLLSPSWWALYQYAHYSYDQAKWLPFNLVDHVLLDSSSIKYQSAPGSSHTIRFGFEVSNQDIHLIIWQYSHRSGHNFFHSLAWAIARKMKYNELKPRRFLIEAILKSLKETSNSKSLFSHRLHARPVSER